MNEALVKSLSDLIDETLAEIEGLKKSRMEAEEMEIGEGKANGSLKGGEVEKADDEEEKEDEEDKEKEEEKEGEMEKGINDEAEMKKADEEVAKAEKLLKEAMKKKESCMAKAEKKMKKEDDEEEKEDEKEKEKEDEEKMEKSIKARVAPLEAKMDEMMKAIAAIAKSPIPSRGISFKDVQPLAKSAMDVQPLVKSQVLDQLIDLKKTGTNVTSEDVLRAELGNQSDVEMIANKYGIK